MKPGDASGQRKETINSETMKRINNKEAASYVESQIPFQANNIHGQNEGDWFVVYSYGEHFPMYAWKAGLGWQGNKDKYSVTTSRHQNQVRPDGINDWHSTEATLPAVKQATCKWQALSRGLVRFFARLKTNPTHGKNECWQPCRG